MELVPVTFQQVRRFVHEHHRHSSPPVVARFSVGLEVDGALIGVAVAGLPSARLLCDGRTIEVTRLCTDGTRNSASKLYGAIIRAAKALGYKRAITYTLTVESGASLKASGWKVDNVNTRGETWARPNRDRERHQPDMLGGPKVFVPHSRIRWRLDL